MPSLRPGGNSNLREIWGTQWACLDSHVKVGSGHRRTPLAGVIDHGVLVISKLDDRNS